MDVIFDPLNDHYVRHSEHSGYRIQVHPIRLLEQAAKLLDTAPIMNEATAASFIQRDAGNCMLQLLSHKLLVLTDGSVYIVEEYGRAP